jgi:prevent-host-death family protein
MTIMTIDPFQIGVAAMSVKNWTVAEAKARFSELIEQAQAKGPQTITKRGRTAAVVVSAAEWERKSKRTGNLAEFFASSPLRDSGIEIKRRKDRPRKVQL